MPKSSRYIKVDYFFKIWGVFVVLTFLLNFPRDKEKNDNCRNLFILPVLG